ncbi:scopoletin glucosyltransferase-like [Macadamia integrifolia]|uniref:scopoletin glucosyltransferase-like n=1 Tax=Macadamia integrifolia TaxID=60698 RepID=UPI001C4E551F|nr:scopoletin glucosyltransferase-like [Macadamia integrifolia]
MGSAEPHQLHIFFFPFMAQGHLLPAKDMARLFASHGVKVTIITTPLNAPLFSNTIDHGNQLGLDISIQLIPFPSEEAGLPPGCENVSSIQNSSELVPKFFKSLDLLQKPLEDLLQEHRPDCLVADMFFPWATDIAAKLGIPSLIFHGTGFFSLCALDSLRRYKPFENIESETQTFIVPNLPDQIELMRSQLPVSLKTPSELWQRIIESEGKSYGVLVNSFYELEPAYADHYRKVIGRKAWHIGPVSLSNRGIADKAQRVNRAKSIEDDECLSWLNSKKPNSVLFVSFGSVVRFTASQLIEIAMGLEASGCSFIWVVRAKDEGEQRWMPEGFEGKGLIIRGWAPQVLILDHPAVGGFVTHCGWNSTLESVSAGVPMITWPIFAEQFNNEKLVTQVLRIGVSVGAHEWRVGGFVGGERAAVKREDIEKAIEQLMGDGEEAEQMRTRAMELKEMGRRAVEAGGSSYIDLTALIEELRLHPKPAV